MKYLIFVLLLLAIFSYCRNVENHSNVNIGELEKRLDLFYNKDLYGHVISITDTLIKLDSTNGSYFYKRAVAYAFFQVYDSSNYYFLKSAKLNYRIRDSYYAIAMRYHLDGNDSVAIKMFDFILSNYPNDSILIRERNEVKKSLIIHNKSL